MAGKIDKMQAMEQEQRMSRRARSILIAILLFGFVAAIYIATVLKFGPAIMGRAL